ncbi:hypothetical protein [Kitasatospora griseola]|uniref:hypothetical protein n=1 Tax=Kitasatospora griseola TaxID=2064 RepID=UPI0037FC4A40
MTGSRVPLTKEALDGPTAATRHLCTGVYVDEEFRDLVINRVCNAPHRRVAPSYGFDIVPVMHHAWRAAALTALLRAALVAAPIAPFLWGDPLASALIGIGLALLVLLDIARRIHSAVREERKGRDPLRFWRAQGRTRLLQWLFPRWHWEENPALRRTATIALSLIAVEAVIARLCPGPAMTALHIAGALVLTCLGIGATRQLMLNHIRRAPSLRPTRLSGRQRVADAQQGHMCTVYRRARHSRDEAEEKEKEKRAHFTLFGDDSHSPFTGAGEIIYHWNPPMNIQLLRPGSEDDAPLHEREYLVPPFQAHELVDYLRGAVQLLGTDEQETRLAAQVRDRVYVAETDVAMDHSLLAEEFDAAGLRAIINSNDTRQYHFLEVVMPTEGSEYVATVLLHVGLQGRTLNISTAACVLAHTPRSFQRTEEFGHHGAVAVVWAAFRELAALPKEIPNTWRLIRYLGALCAAAVTPRDLTAKPIRNILIGSRISVRQEAAQAWSKVQLEKTDLTGRMKTLEERLLRAAEDFLNSRDVDVSEFSSRALKIINSGIFNFGDNNTISNNAVGDSAQVLVGANQGAGSNDSNNGGNQ